MLVKATGTSTGRTIPARLAEIHNVRDFGALADGTDDSPGIQAAVDWTSGANRGTIYFPPGTYNPHTTITLNRAGSLYIRLLGDIGTLINGNVAGFVFDRALGSPSNYDGQIIFDRMGITNSTSGAGNGCIRAGSINSVIVRESNLAGFINITTEDSVGVSSLGLHVENTRFGSNGLGMTAGQHHIITGGGGLIQGCNLGFANCGVRAYGKGLSIQGNRSENCIRAYMFGLDSGDNNVGLEGLSMESCSSEGNIISYHFAGLVTGFCIAAVGHQGHDVGNGGPDQSQASQYSFLIDADCVDAGVFQGCTSASFHANAGLSLAAATVRRHVLFRDCNFQQAGGAGVNVILPSNAYTAKFRNCNFNPVWHYSQLPAGGNVLEGDEFDIDDGTNGLAWGDTVTNTGTHTTHYRVRHNGTVYTVVGK
jgi:hypothetical protein